MFDCPDPGKFNPWTQLNLVPSSELNLRMQLIFDTKLALWNAFT